MTKTDWTAEEVRNLAQAMTMIYGQSAVRAAEAIPILLAFANRIEADESAVPVAWMRRTIRHKRIGGREEGERVMSASKVYPDDEPLFTHPPAQPAQEQPGWKVPDGYGPEVKISRRCTGCKALMSEPYQVQSDSGCNIYCAHPAFSHLDGSRKYINDSCRDTPDWCPAAFPTPPKEK